MNIFQIYIILYYIQINCLNLSQKCSFDDINKTNICCQGFFCYENTVCIKDNFN